MPCTCLIISSGNAAAVKDRSDTEKAADAPAFWPFPHWHQSPVFVDLPNVAHLSDSWSLHHAQQLVLNTQHISELNVNHSEVQQK